TPRDNRQRTPAPSQGWKFSESSTSRRLRPWLTESKEKASTKRFWCSTSEEVPSMYPSSRLAKDLSRSSRLPEIHTSVVTISTVASSTGLPMSSKSRIQSTCEKIPKHYSA